jgi:hypothetical protein
LPRILIAIALSACTPSSDAPSGVVDREPGDRTPLSDFCDSMDPTRCALPWPSNTFTGIDENTETGLRVVVTPQALPVDDDVAFLNAANGFSRISGVATAFETSVNDVADWDPAHSLASDAPMQILNAQPGHPDYGTRVAYRTELQDLSLALSERWLYVGRPVEVLAPNCDYVVVILDEIGVEPERRARVALGLVDPQGEDERLLAGYHAPTRTLLQDAGVDAKRVVRVWDFTTRSADDPTKRMHSMMDTLDDAVEDLGIEIDSVSVNSAPEIAAIVRGRLTHAPRFLGDDGLFAFDGDGFPVVTGTGSIEFRISVPASGEDYRVALYGHGTGGDVTDSSFDRELAAENIAKLNLRFDGWTGEDFVVTLTEFSSFLDGSARSTMGLMESLAGGTVLLTSLDGILGDTLSQPTLAGESNPAAGFRPLTDEVVWVGGSMGGTMGAVMVSADERLTTGVLNVPGSGWTHMVPYSLLYSSGMESIMMAVYGDLLDLQVGMVMAQNNWDDVDGAVWADEALAVGGAFLLQESIDDPILPNLGTELLANALGAVQFEPYLQPVVGLSSTAGSVTSGAALEQFRVPETGQYDVHGFAALDTPAAEAAMDQILGLLNSAWAGQPEMSHPIACEGPCDYIDAW